MRIIGIVLGILGIVLGILVTFWLLRIGLNLYSYRATVKNARVLICVLGESSLLAQTAEQDAEIYRRHFPTVSLLKAEKLSSLLSALESGNFNILHLVNDFNEDGSLVEGQATHADVAPLLELCRAKNLLFVYLAGDIPEKNRTTTLESLGAVYKSHGGGRVGRNLPLVITMDRGTEFGLFLDRLLREIASGKFLGNAWLKIRPQDMGSGAPQPAVDPGPWAIVTI